MSTSITTASLSDSLLTTVPKLDSMGTNWAILVFRFHDAIEGKGYWSHYDGTLARPVAKIETQPTDAKKVANGKMSVKERWELVVKEFSKKLAYTQTDLQAKFMAMRCPEKTNPRKFLETLRVKREELSQAGITIEEKDYLSVILSSLPFALSNFASSILVSSQISSKHVTPDDLLSMLMEESDCQRAQ